MIDQDAQATVKVEEEDVSIKEILYKDFLNDGVIYAPWVEMDVNEGNNTLYIERNNGYSVNVKEFQVIGRKEGAPALPSSSSSEPPVSSSSAPSSSSEPSSSSAPSSSSSSAAPTVEGYDITFVPDAHSKVFGMTSIIMAVTGNISSRLMIL